MSPSTAAVSTDGSSLTNKSMDAPSDTTKVLLAAQSSKQMNSTKDKGPSNGGAPSAAKSNDTTPEGNPTGTKSKGEMKLEAKMKAKAEKAARRAQEKTKQEGQPTALLAAQVQTDGKNKNRRPSTSAPAAPSPSKPQHKRTGSSGQKPLPIRGADPQPTTTPSQPKREEKKVALFDHLYGQPRRTTLAGAAKDTHPAILALGLQMSSYVICGSNARCVATLLAFKEVIHSYSTPPQTSLTRHLTTHLSSQIEYLISCRPLSVSMGNAIRWLKLEISEIDVSTPESTAKAALCVAIDEFIRERITVADQVIAEKAAEKIRDGEVIITYAKSSIVQKTLIEAFKRGRKFRVIVVDSRPLFEGKNLARALADLGLEVQYSLLHGLDHVIPSVTKAFLGAHAMTSNGRLYSRVGSALVAMTAKESNIPVIVCCESIKFTDRVALDSFVLNEIAPPDELVDPGTAPETGLDKWREIPGLQLLNLMYDLTPAEYINMVITEYGSLPPSSVPVVHRLSTNS